MIDWPSARARAARPTTYVIGAKRVEHVVRQTREQVDHKPGFYVIALDYCRIRDNLAAGPNECRVEIEQNIDGKHNVNNTRRDNN